MTTIRYAAIYCRVSTEDQSKGYSLPTQLEACQKLAAHEGYTVPETHILTDDLTGTTLERPGLRRLRELVTSKAIAAVVVYEADRLARRFALQVILEEEMEQAGVKLCYVNYTRDETPEGKAYSYMRGVWAEVERLKILERTRRGMLGRAKAGYAFGGNVPLGYRYVGEPHRGRLEIEEAEAAVVHRIFEMCLAGMSTWVIARRLTDERVPTKRDRQPWAPHAAGGKGLKVSGVGGWHHASVRNILTNEAYIGRQCWNKRQRRTKTTVSYRPPEEWISIPVPPIVSASDFAAARAQLTRNQVNSLRNRKREYLLVGRRLRCGRCGRAMVGFYSKGTRRYRCSTVVNVADPDQRCRGSVNADLVEGEVWTAVERVLAQPELIAAEVERQYGTLDELRAASERAKQPIHAALARCDREDQKWLDAYAKEAISADELKQYRLDIETRRHAIRSQLAELDARIAGATQAAGQVAALTQYCERVRRKLQRFDAAEKRLAFEALNLQVTWTPGERLAIQGSIPLEEGSFVASTARCDRSVAGSWRRTPRTSRHHASTRRS